ncbi:MAG TPA: hypothetical protein VFM57_08205 [Thermoleophilaceae bacterium]|nr:hypothetical protein [Thermoleophilaceae bacterium]HKS78411.1 hypothetical protein [Gaiellaceae bacterium]
MTEHPELESYLDRLRRELDGPRRYQQEMIAEIRAHLTELADSQGDAYTIEGVVGRFGDPDLISAELNEARRTTTRRRTCRALAAATSLAAIASAFAITGLAPRSGTPTRLDAAGGKLTKAPIAVTLDPHTGAVLLRRRLELPSR